ncbi:hypothetical protein V493_08424 [Pseudogymnoascus sp. VKM F-4281 (FW-2241)]|nr:hypothetical protein V493_08424 [Pseudogymnoascus sp. VKM F-4281 (FW-2241)]
MGFMRRKSNTDAIEHHEGDADAYAAGNVGNEEKSVDTPQPPTQNNGTDSDQSGQTSQPVTKQHMKKYMGLSGRNLNLAISVVATNGFLLFGYDQGVMSGIITDPVFNDYFPATRHNSTVQGITTGIYEIGCLLGAVFILIFGEWLGRRRACITGGWVMILGVIIQVASFTGHQPFVQFMVGRTITGVGNGINTSTIPTYQAECSKSSNRGLLICIEGATIAFGTMIAYWINYGSQFSDNGSVHWRWPIAFQILFGLFLSIVMVFLPESPRWLISRERYEEGESVLASLRGKDTHHPEVQEQKKVIMNSIRAAGKGASFSSLFTGGKTQHTRRMLVGSSAQLFQQIGGCNAVIYYLPVLLEESLGQTRKISLVVAAVNATCYAAFSTTSWFLIERVGRRALFLWGTVGQCLAMVITFACLIPSGIGQETTTPAAKEAAKGGVFGLFVFIIVFGATWLPLPWLYPAEVNPIKTRGKANAISTCTNWLFNFVVVMVTPIMVANIGWATYLVFAIINACFLPVIFFFYPETQGRSLEEIDIIFAKGYMEKMNYVKASHELPMLTDNQVGEYAREYDVDKGPDFDQDSRGSGEGQERAV